MRLCAGTWTMRHYGWAQTMGHCGEQAPLRRACGPCSKRIVPSTKEPDLQWQMHRLSIASASRCNVKVVLTTFLKAVSHCALLYSGTNFRLRRFQLVLLNICALCGLPSRTIELSWLGSGRIRIDNHLCPRLDPILFRSGYSGIHVRRKVGIVSQGH